MASTSIPSVGRRRQINPLVILTCLRSSESKGETMRRAALVAMSIVMMATLVVAPGFRSDAFAGRLGPAGTLVLASANAIELVSPTTGAVLRTVPIPRTYELALDASAPDSQMAVAPDGKVAYVTVTNGPGSDDLKPLPPEILAVPLDGGRPTVAATAAVAPAVSPDGNRLAYLEEPLPPEGTARHGFSETVVVLNFKSGTRKAYDLRAAYFEANGPVGVNGLSWSPSSLTLAVSVIEFADVFGSFDSASLLNPAVAVSPEGNPKQVRVRGIAQSTPPRTPPQFLFGFQSATYVTNGEIALISDEPSSQCAPPADACGIVKSQVLLVDPTSGRATFTFTAPARSQGGWFAVDQVAFGPHGLLYILGRNDVCTTCQPVSASDETLFGVSHDEPVQLGKGEGYGAVAWSTRSITHGHAAN
jgi:hypothetical protein